MDRTAADEVEAQAPHSLSALMQAHQQLLKTSIDTANVKIQWKDFYDGCREIIEVFQIYGMAADEVETQTPHSFSALMQAHQQLLKTSIDTANVKIQWKDFYDRCREIIEVFQIYGMAVDEVETQTPHSFSALMQAHQQLLKTSIDTANVKIQWKDFYDRCREIIEVFQIYGMAADEVETQTPHSFSALMQAHQQLLKTSIDTANVKIQWKDFYDGCREIIEVFQIYGMAADEVETQTPHSLSALMQAHQQLLKTSIDTANVKIQWKDFYDRCREIIEVFQMDMGQL